MKKPWTLMILVGLLLAVGCASPLPYDPTPVPTLAPATLPPEPTAVPPAPSTPTPEETPPPPEPTTEPAGFAGLPLPTERAEFFSASGACAVCHTNMVDGSGADVSTDTFWRATMMANAIRDPFHEARIRAEAIVNPQLQAVIEDKCTTCHTPMARFTAVTQGGVGQVLDDGFLDPGHEFHTLAVDGVSCTVCHQINETDFGQPASFSGGYVIDAEQPAGERLLYGPYEVPEGLAQLMQASSGFNPVPGPHMEESELCAACHTLYTPYVNAAGEVAGEFPEQTPYLEWLNSDFADEQSCQGCHMPLADGGVQLSVTGGPPRSPFYQHTFVGGNAFMLEIFKTFGEEMSVTASSEQFEITQERVIDQLQSRTATVALEGLELSESALTADVAIEVMVGHKLPTGFPSRRVWLHITVSDTDGLVIFESGAVGSDGAIAGNDNDADRAAYEPHYLEITSADQVQIYEAVMQDTEGALTTVLLYGAGYAKDNRLLPNGFDKASADADIAVYGQAAGDADFDGGGDTVRYVIDVGDAQGPFTVNVELLYQSIGYRWARNLGQYDGPEPERFARYYDAVPNLPVALASATAEVGE